MHDQEINDFVLNDGNLQNCESLLSKELNQFLVRFTNTCLLVIVNEYSYRKHLHCFDKNESFFN